MDSVSSQVTLVWSGTLIITGDINIDLLKPTNNTQKRYNDLLDSYNLTQHIQKPTRQNALIDHMITNLPRKILKADVLPTPEISDHDCCYICINARTTRFEPRYKFIRNFKTFDMNEYVKDFAELPFSIIYGVQCSDEKLSILNDLLLGCIERHAPTKKIKVTRPPAPWLHDLDMIKLKQAKKKLRFIAHQTKEDQDWKTYREIRNEIKSEIKATKKAFYKTALSSKRPSEVWKCINKILHPQPNRIKADPDKINNHFNTTATRLLNCTPTEIEDLHTLVDSLPNTKNSFEIKQVTHDQVLNELKWLRLDCSSGYDGIPVKLLKPVAEFLASPLTHIINTGITNQMFHKLWKINKITPIPKIDNPVTNDDYRPVSVLPILGTNHSTQTLLLKIRDDIQKSLNRGEITIAVLADYSKAFDTMNFAKLIPKLHKVGFSNNALRWVVSYLTGRYQFVQIDDKQSISLPVLFGVPQGSIMGPILFNLYVSDLQDNVISNTSQYADDTSFYEHATVKI